MKQKVIIIGSGIGGLSTALRLSQRGYEVEILEKNAQAGGRLNQIKKDGFTYDTGPSFFSMSYEFQELARDCGIKLPFDIVELDPLYAVNFSGNPKFFQIYKDPKLLAQEFEKFEPDFEQKMRFYLKKASRVFNDTVDIVIKRNFDSILDYILALMKVNPVHLPLLFRNFWQEVSLNFSSKEVRQILSLVAFFLGRTPFDTMAVYTLLSYTEFQHDGYYNVKGGMYKIVEGFVSELINRGVKINYNVEIVDFLPNNGKLQSVVDKDNRVWNGDIFVVNADAAVFRSKVFKRKRYSEENLAKMDWTMGYLTLYLGLKTKLPNVHHHNYFLGSNYEEYSKNILTSDLQLEKPYYYVNVISRSNPECAPEGCEALFFVCPVPNLLFKQDWSDKDKIVDSIIKDFSKRIGKDIEPDIISKTVFTPIDWQNKFNLYKGSGLGLAHNFRQIGGLRPKNFDEEFSNVFYVGASTVPGAGLPMGIISSKLVTERVERYSKQTI
jgi:phytoene desaturase